MHINMSEITIKSILGNKVIVVCQREVYVFLYVHCSAKTRATLVKCYVHAKSSAGGS